jgi:hypothetical protein
MARPSTIQPGPEHADGREVLGRVLDGVEGDGGRERQGRHVEDQARQGGQDEGSRIGSRTQRREVSQRRRTAEVQHAHDLFSRKEAVGDGADE